MAKPLPEPEARPIDVAAAIEMRSGGWYSGFVLVLCCAAMVVEGYDVQIVAYAAPAMIRDWHVDKAYFAPVFSAALLGYTLGATLLSGFGARIGRKRVLVFGNLSFGLLTIPDTRGFPALCV
jgi:AAHS family 4-hydroxybenzoate transporter-like MFS transporter